MKKVLSLLLVAAMLVCMMPGMAFADEAKDWKVAASVASGETTASVIVYDDYSVVANVAGTVVDTALVEASISMQNVASLGVTTPRTATYAFETGMPNNDVNLDYWMSDLFAFEGCNVVGTVDGLQFAYGVVASGEPGAMTATATPADEDAVRAAYQALAANITAGTAADNSQVVIPAGASLQIGTEVLTFAADCVVDPSAPEGIYGAVAGVKDAASLATGVAAADSEVVLYVPAGSVLQIGGSTATVNNGMTVYAGVPGKNLTSGTMLSELRASTDPVTVIMGAVAAVNAAAVGLNGETLVVDVVFDAPAPDTPDWKVNAAVGSGETVANVTVFEDYSIVATAEGTIVDPAMVQASISMKNVAGLGVSGERTANYEFVTGLPSRPVDLTAHLDKVYAFEGAVINGKVNGAEFAYDVEATTDGAALTAVATPSSTADVRAAWQIVAGEVATSTGDENSQIIVPAGATLQVGTEKLTFAEEAIIDPNGSNLKGAVEAVQAAAALETGLAESATEMYIPAGSVLHVGSSLAELERGATVKVTDGIVADGVLSALREAANGNNKAFDLVSTVVAEANAAVGALSAAGTMDVEILFDQYVTCGEDVYAVPYGDMFTMPAGTWTDGTNYYFGGTAYEITEDVTLTKVYTGGGSYVPSTPAEPEVDEDAELKAAVEGLQLVARSEMSTAKGKKAVRVSWFEKNGADLSFLEGYEVFRSTKRFSGFGTKPIFTTERTKYWNTDIEEGMKYFYKVRGFVTIDGEKSYTDWSLKAWRTVE